MIWALTRPIVWPAKAGAYSVAAGYRTGRFLGFRRLTVFLLGVGTGLLLAPVPGRELREKLRELLQTSEPFALPAVTPSVVPLSSVARPIDLTR